MVYHKTKQKALDLATGEWILQMDADERVSSRLGKEIKQIVQMSEEELKLFYSMTNQLCLNILRRSLGLGLVNFSTD